MTHSALLEAVQAELELLSRFFFTLEKEHQTLLSSYNNNELFDLTELKNQYADAMAQAAIQRDHVLAEHQLETGLAGLTQAQALSSELADSVQQLLELTTQARELNEKNGVLINAYLEYTTEALNTLQKHAAPTADVYNAQGKKQTPMQSRRGYTKA